MTTREMTAEELRPIVEAWGGVEEFAKMIDVHPKTVRYWLEKKRKIRPMVAAFIRSLATKPSSDGEIQ